MNTVITADFGTAKDITNKSDVTISTVAIGNDIWFSLLDICHLFNVDLDDASVNSVVPATELHVACAAGVPMTYLSFYGVALVINGSEPEVAPELDGRGCSAALGKRVQYDLAPSDRLTVDEYLQEAHELEVMARAFEKMQRRFVASPCLPNGAV